MTIMATRMMLCIIREEITRGVRAYAHTTKVRITKLSKQHTYPHHLYSSSLYTPIII